MKDSLILDYYAIMALYYHGVRADPFVGRLDVAGIAHSLSDP